MTSRIRSRHSRSPRGPNDIQYHLAQFPCGTHNPMERERVCREIQTEDIDFGDPHIARGPTKPDKHIQSVNAFSPRILAAMCLQQTLLQLRCSFRATAYPEHLREEDRESHDIIQDFRDVRTVIHEWSPRKLWLLHQGLNYYQSRQYCLMPCHLCVEEEDGITYRCRQCVRPRLPEQREACLRLHHQCLCDKHFYQRGPPTHVNPA